MDLAAALVADFIVCAVTDPMPGQRRIVKLSYEEPFEALTSRRFLAWRWYVLQFDAGQTHFGE
jgi:hypothetical protein